MFANLTFSHLSPKSAGVLSGRVASVQMRNLRDNWGLFTKTGKAEGNYKEVVKSPKISNSWKPLPSLE